MVRKEKGCSDLCLGTRFRYLLDLVAVGLGVDEPLLLAAVFPVDVLETDRADVADAENLLAENVAHFLRFLDVEQEVELLDLE